MAALTTQLIRLWRGQLCLSHTKGKIIMDLNSIAQTQSGDIHLDIERLKEKTQISDTVDLKIKDVDGKNMWVRAEVKAKYPHTVNMEYIAKSGRKMKLSLGWNKLMLILIKGGSVGEDGEEE